ncbi:MAG: hypothetical protein ACXWYS_01825 [Gaiellaceae bacterium]
MTMRRGIWLAFLVGVAALGMTPTVARDLLSAALTREPPLAGTTDAFTSMPALQLRSGA